ncbi:phenazine biosynthesis-like domain-containing protein 1 [Patella vulgata]|uniref:phenazine biosynthesis-like domain-containing protein 1 n=1 Tax=Patella vulgata TaxID=6465 RepID=UPI00217FDD34|nr:phenazine biosynthesis-like domain-containing protein 1 [Patella vulgata]
MSNSDITLYKLDVFADTIFAGNPAAVCVLTWGLNLSDETMMKISAEMGSTAGFLSRIKEQDSFSTANKFNLRWFTTKSEVKLCGHATLATGAVLTRYYDNQSDGITFITSGGDLVVRKEGSKISMNLPVNVSTPQNKEDYSKLISSFGDLPNVEEVQYCSSLNYVLIVLSTGWTRKEFEEWRPDIPTIHKAGDNGILKVAVITMSADGDTAFKDADGNRYDFVSRVFGPWLGADEDPVTGSAHTILANYWSKKLGKIDFYARQCSPRGGDVNIHLQGDRVDLKGNVIKVLQGTMDL